MAKKKKDLPAYVLKQFNKALYKPGEQVTIKWLGQIKTGYVIKNYKTNWGVCYTVEVTDMALKHNDRITRYPCGIQIKKYRTQYDVGLILHGYEQSGDIRTSKGIYAVTGSGEVTIGNDNTSVGGHDDSNNRENARARASTTHKDDVKSSSTRVRTSNAETSATNLDDAIDRQKDFLNGFVKD